jgi:AcrR family transcriptional regulator
VPKVIGGSLEAHRDVTRERIFDALARLMYERGYDSTSLADVAEAAGLARTAMYNYFPDKESLLVEHVGRETDRYVAQLRDALREVDDPVGQMRAYIRHQLTYFSENHLPPGPALRHLLPQDAFGKILDHVQALEDALLSILRAGVDGRYMLSEDLAATASMINACIGRGSSLHPDPEDLERTIALTESFVLRALGARVLADGSARRIPRRR